jgi:hypothetical protein
LLLTALPPGPGIPAGSELTFNYTNNDFSSLKLLASWGFTPALKLMPHAIAGRPDMVLPAQCWALSGLNWQLLAWAACELYVTGTLRFRAGAEVDVSAVIR